MKKCLMFICSVFLVLTLFPKPVLAQEEPMEEEEVEEVVEEEEEFTEEILEDEIVEEEIEVENAAVSSSPIKTLKLVQYATREEVEKQIQKGSIGFFETFGATQAISYLKNASYARYTNNPQINGKYDPYDATSLENMKDAISGIRECNRLRRLEGCSELLVTNELMAISQSNTNAGHVLYNHCNQYNVGENLAWGYANPFDGWYTGEKIVYDYMKAHPNASKKEIVEACGLWSEDFVQTGHYENVVDKSYMITGFSYQDDPNMYHSNNYTAGQVFFWSSSKYESSGRYTVDDYETMFLSYYNNLMSQLNCTLTYDANGGSNAPANQSFLANESFTLSSQIPTRKGYDFAGWKLNNNTYQASQSVNFKESVTLFAQWNPKKIKVTFDANGGVATKESMYVYYDSTYGSLPTAIKSQSTFLGWYTAATGGTKITNTTKVSKDVTHTLYAHYEREYGRIEGYSASASSDIVLKCYVSIKPEWLNDSQNYIKFTLDNGKVQTIKLSEGTATTYNDVECRIYPCRVSAKEMTENIRVQVCGKSATLSREQNISIESYVNMLIANYGSDNYFCKKAKAMLTYGYYAQQYFGYKTDQLPKSINSLSNVDFSNYEKQLSDKNNNVDFVGARLVLTSKPAIKLYFTGSATFKVDGVTKTTTKEGKYTVLEIEDITSFSKMYSITTTNFTLKYGLYSYAQDASKTSNTKLKNLTKAMYAYQQA